MQCATHPSVETELTCSRCGKPICPRCLIQTPVGARCRECANVRRIPMYNIGGLTLARAAGSALGGGISVGIAWWLFNPLTSVFFGAIVGFVAGFAVGEIVSLGTNRKAGPALQAVAVGGVVLAYLMRVALLFLTGVWAMRDLRADLFGLIALGIASFIAAGRLR